MSDDHEQIVVRRRKLAALRERGSPPFPTTSGLTTRAGEVHERFGAASDDELAGAAEVAVAGRVMAIRHFGKAGFVDPAGPRAERCRCTCGATPSATRPSRSIAGSTPAT